MTLLSSSRGSVAVIALVLTASLSGLLFSFQSARAVVGDGTSTALNLLDTNGNGKIDAVDVEIDNGNGGEWIIVGNPGFAVTQGGNSITVVDVVAASASTDNPFVARVLLDETDVDLVVDTDGVLTNPIELVYAPEGGDPAFCEDCVADEDDELNAIAAVDTNATNIELDLAGPALLSAEFQDTDVDGRVERVVISATEDLDTCTYADGDWSFSTPGTVGFDDETNVTCDGSTITVTVFGDEDVTGGATNPVVEFVSSSGMEDSEGNDAASATLTVSDAAAPVVYAGLYEDQNGDGTVDDIRFVVTIDADIDFTYDPDSWTVTTPGSINLTKEVDAIYAFGNISIDATGDVGETGSSIAPVVEFVPEAGQLIDVYGNELIGETFTFTLSDDAGPVFLSAVYLDTNADGQVDSVDVAATEEIDTATYEADDWSFASQRGSIGLLEESAISVAGSTIRLTASGDERETGGVTNPVLEFVTSSRVTDAANNDAVSATLTVTDGAAPAVYEGDYVDLNGDGTVDFVNVYISHDQGIAFTHNDASWTVLTPGTIALDDESDGELEVDSIALTVTAAANRTGGTTEPVIRFIPGDGELVDGASNEASDTFTLNLLDLANPVLYFSNPEDSASNVNRSSDIEVTFSELIESSLLTYGDDWTLTSNGVDIDYDEEHLDVVFSDDVDAQRSAVVFSHDPFGSNKDIVLSLHEGAVTDLEGNDLEASIEISFTTRSSGGGSGGGGSVGGGTSSTAASVDLTAPVSSDVFEAEDTTTITWTNAGSGADTVKLEYSTDAGDSWTKIADNIDKEDGEYDWMIPDLESDQMIIKITLQDSGKATLDTDTSSVFQVVATGTPTPSTDAEDNITTDDAGRRWAPGSGEYGTSPYDGSMEEISTVESGWYIRGEHYNAVYYVSSNSVRRVFWDTQTFFTWTDSWSDVVWVTDATLAIMELGDPMLPKAGVTLVKVQSDAKTFATDMTGSTALLRWIPDEQTAMDLYGEEWADYVIDIDPTIIGHYTEGDTMTTSDDVNISTMRTRQEIASLAD